MTPGQRCVLRIDDAAWIAQHAPVLFARMAKDNRNCADLSLAYDGIANRFPVRYVAYLDNPDVARRSRHARKANKAARRARKAQRAA